MTIKSLLNRATSFQFQLLSIVLVFIVLGALFFIFSLYSHNIEHINDDLEQITTTSIFEYDEEIESLSRTLSLAMEVLLHNEKLIELFAKRDREALLNLTQDLYNNTLKPQYSINRFHFHLPTAQSFLRIHKPEKFGDDLSGFRHMVLYANQKLAPAKGIEVGRTGIVLRVVYPILHNGIHVGSVELGANLGEGFKSASNVANINYAIGIYKDVSERARRFSVHQSDIVVGDVVFPKITDPLIRKALRYPKNETIEISGLTFIKRSFPVIDFRGEAVGRVVMFIDITTYWNKQLDEFKKAILIVIIFTILLCASIVFFLRRSIVKPLKQSICLAKALSVGNYDYQIEINGNSEIHNMLHAFNDGIKSLKTLQDEAIRSAQLASIGELSASIAHEINNPISGVINYSQILLNRQDLNEKQHDLITRIQKDGERVANIVRNLLNYARDAKEQKSYCHIVDIVTDTLVLLDTKFKNEKVLLDFDWADDLPKIKCIEQQIEQVLINILRNAYQALAEKEPADRMIRISGSIETVHDHEYLQLVIANNGPNIPPEMLNKIMEPFVTTKPAGSGTGLGLSVTSTIMKKHNGQFELRSEPGEFTEMILRFPVD